MPNATVSFPLSLPLTPNPTSHKLTPSLTPVEHKNSYQIKTKKDKRKTHNNVIDLGVCVFIRNCTNTHSYTHKAVILELKKIDKKTKKKLNVT